MSMIRSAKLALIVLSVLAFQSVSHAEAPAGKQVSQAGIDYFAATNSAAGSLLLVNNKYTGPAPVRAKPNAGVNTNKSANTTVDENEIKCLANNIYYESGNQSKEGKIAVGMVTINRAEDSRFPKSICGVINQRSGRTCQFSWKCHRVPAIDRSSVAWRESHNIALLLLTVPDIYQSLKKKYGNALYFHAVYVRPGWANRKSVVSRVGGHIFYRDR